VTAYELIVIGSGPAGRRAAIQAAKLGHSVLVVEKGRRVGGVSVHTGTIPSKTLRETVLNLTGWRERGFYGRAYRVKKDIAAADLMMRLHKTLDHEVDVLEHQFARNAVDTVCGAARFVDPHRIEVVDQAGDACSYDAERVVIGRTGPTTCRSTASTCSTATTSWKSAACRAVSPWSAPASSEWNMRRSSARSTYRSRWSSHVSACSISSTAS
jgi:pyruvate/2-oxoglutarate dehydrogenase complex dihydrolipoamide dehydrogenase (E3) component